MEPRQTNESNAPQPANARAGGRIPPQAVDVERAVLGALLIEREAIPKAVELLQADAFYQQSHQIIYEAITHLFERGNPVDLITVTDELRRRGKLDSVGGTVYVTELSTGVATAANVEYHARIIAEKSLLRNLIETMTRSVGRAYEPGADAFELLDDAESDLFKVSDQHLRRAAASMNEVIKETLERLEHIHSLDGGVTGTPSGFSALDQLTGGWQDSDLIILAARPSMGKCLGKGTPILMFDGSIKRVEAVNVGDVLCGDDLKPRMVTALGRGREKMYRIEQGAGGMTYRVNAAHILTLAHVDQPQRWFDLEIERLLALPDFLKEELRGVQITSLHDDRWVDGDVAVATKPTVTLHQLTITEEAVDQYFGFTVDGNGRFLLGDGTVTHNTAFSLSIARNAALHKESPTGVAIFSLEMSAQQLAQRLLTSEARVDAQAARTGRLSDGDWQRLARAAGRLSAAPIYIDDTPALTVLELRAKCRRLKAEHDIGLIVVDYLQLMQGSNQNKGSNREQEIAQISRSLKSLAKELNVPVLALSQLSRAVETRAGEKKPMLSDLRESGSIEQDADVVMFIYRAERYGILQDDEGHSTEGLAEIIISKQRNGPTGEIKVAFVNQYARFENLARYVDPSTTQVGGKSPNENTLPSGDEEFGEAPF